MTKEETIQVLQSIEDRAVKFPNMTACDWVAIAAAKRHLENSLEVKDSLELTVEDIKMLDALLIKMWNDKSDNKYEEVLKQFNAQKGEQQ